MKYFLALLGKRLDQIRADPFLASLRGRPKIKQIDDRYYMGFRNAGISFDASSDGRVTSIFLYSEGHEGYRAYAGRLPGGIQFAESRKAVRNKLGKPSATGGGNLVPGLGKLPFWDAYDYDGHYLHIQYSEKEDSITLVTLMLPDAVPK